MIAATAKTRPRSWPQVPASSSRYVFPVRSENPCAELCAPGAALRPYGLPNCIVHVRWASEHHAPVEECLWLVRRGFLLFRWRRTHHGDVSLMPLRDLSCSCWTEFRPRPPGLRSYAILILRLGECCDTGKGAARPVTWSVVPWSKGSES